MITIRQILSKKGDRIVGVGANADLAEAARTMSTQGVGALAVRDGQSIVGLLSERDLVLSLAQLGTGAATVTATVAMQPAPEIDIDEEILQGLRMMTDRRRRHLLVREEGRIVGMVSIGDLVKAMHEEQVGTISSLHQYITG